MATKSGRVWVAYTTSHEARNTAYDIAHVEIAGTYTDNDAGKAAGLGWAMAQAEAFVKKWGGRVRLYNPDNLCDEVRVWVDEIPNEFLGRTDYQYVWVLRRVTHNPKGMGRGARV